jgi:hypothetical protein
VRKHQELAQESLFVGKVRVEIVAKKHYKVSTRLNTQKIILTCTYSQESGFFRRVESKAAANPLEEGMVEGAA